MPDRAQDWLDQAERDLELACIAQKNDRHEWACFASQQAAEKALKALHLHHGEEVWGHVVAKLLEELPMNVPADLRDKAKVLDNFYVATRYANGHVEGAPHEHYGQIQSNDGIEYAEEIIGFASDEMAE